MEAVHLLYLLSQMKYDTMIRMNAQPDEFGLVETIQQCKFVCVCFVCCEQNFKVVTADLR